MFEAEARISSCYHPEWCTDFTDAIPLHVVLSKMVVGLLCGGKQQCLRR